MVSNRTSRSPTSSKPQTVCTAYTVLCHREGGGGEPERMLEGQQFTQLGRKYQHDWLNLQCITSDKHLPQSSFTGQFFTMTTFFIASYESYLSTVAIRETGRRTLFSFSLCASAWLYMQCIMYIRVDGWMILIRRNHPFSHSLAINRGTHNRDCERCSD
jgi:hypothetical protein